MLASIPGRSQLRKTAWYALSLVRGAGIEASHMHVNDVHCIPWLLRTVLLHVRTVDLSSPHHHPPPPDIDASFKSYLTQLAPILLSKEKLRVKKIMGTPLTGKGLLECFKVGLAGLWWLLLTQSGLLHTCIGHL